MRIGIDISQLAYSNTGVANYLESLLSELVRQDKKNNYVFLFSSMRRNLDLKKLEIADFKNVELKRYRLPQSLLRLLWNQLHILSVESLVGDVDLFITSDWTEPPVRNAKKGTIVYDMVVFKSPEETHESIVKNQIKKLKWVKKESDFIITISESSKNDIHEILKIDQSRIKVIYPGIN